MSCDWRRSLITHPDAISFLRILGERVFQQPRDLSPTTRLHPNWPLTFRRIGHNSEGKSTTMPDRDENRSDAALLEALVAACVHRGEALDHGHIATANTQFGLGTRLTRELLARGQYARNGILDLLNNENPYVRLHAAFVALELDPSRAEPVLEAIGRDHKDLNLGFSARFTLEQWRAGNLLTISKWNTK